MNDETIAKNIVLPLENPPQLALFTNETFKKHLETYFNTSYRVKLNIVSKNGTYSPSLIEIVGQQSSINPAHEELLTIIALCQTKTFDKTTSQKFFVLDFMRLFFSLFLILF